VAALALTVAGMVTQRMCRIDHDDHDQDSGDERSRRRS
jgi:hypothetical protein